MMNDAHLHLILNHLPIIIPVIGLLIMVGALIIKSDLLKSTAYFVFMLAALTAIPTFSTGEGAEEVIEKLAGVDENLIKTHEEIAEKFAILCYVLGGISLLGLWANFYRKSLSAIISYITILICIVTLYYAKQTGTTGGEIRHIEIRENVGIAPTKSAEKK